MSKKSSPKLKDLTTKKNPKGGSGLKMQTTGIRDSLVTQPTGE